MTRYSHVVRVTTKAILIWSFVVTAMTLFPEGVVGAPLTEEEIARRALDNASFTSVLDAERNAAQAAAAAAGRWANPQVEWAREHLTSADNYEDVVLLSQVVDISGRLWLASDAAEQDAKAVEHRQKQVRATRAARARQAFVTVLFHQERYAILEGWRHTLAELAGAVRARADAGDTARYEARRLEAQVSRQDATLAIANSARESAWTELLILIGETRSSATPWPRAQGTLLRGSRPAEIAANPEGVTRRGDIAALDAEVAAAEARESAASRWWVPPLRLQGGFKGVHDGTADAQGVVVGVGIDLPLFDRKQGEDDRQIAIARGLAARREALRRAATLRLHDRQRAAVELLHAAEKMNTGAAQAADELAQTARQIYLAGELSVVELLDAHQNALETKLEVLVLALHAREAVIELDREMGVVP